MSILLHLRARWALKARAHPSASALSSRTRALRHRLHSLLLQMFEPPSLCLRRCRRARYRPVSGGFTGEIILHSADYKTLLLTFSLPTLKHELSSIFSQSGDVNLCFQVLKATSRRGRFSLPIYKGLPLFSLSVSSSLFLRCVRYQCLSLFVSQRSSVAILSARFRSVCILHVCL